MAKKRKMTQDYGSVKNLITEKRKQIWIQEDKSKDNFKVEN